MFRAREILAASAALVCFCITGNAQAHKLNPCFRALTYSQGVLSEAPLRLRNLCPFAPTEFKAAVHEHMTNFAVSSYRGTRAFPTQRDSWEGKADKWRFNYMSEAAWRKDRGSLHKTSDIIFGIWWNDDPLMFLQGQGNDFRKGVMNLRQVFAEKSRAQYAGGIAHCQVAAGDHLARWSHFGALQHLHFMTPLSAARTRQERVADTRERALVWIEFAYAVATGDIAPDAALTHEDEQRLSLPPLAKNLCLQDAANGKVRSLFTRIGPRDHHHIEARNEQTPDVALGSILHVLQDSFSPSHTCRVERVVDGVRKALLRDVYNYNEQNHEVHAALDGYPAWLLQYASSDGRTHVYANDPVAVGEWLLSAVDDKRPWNEVRDHLLATVFADDGPDTSAALPNACIGRDDGDELTRRPPRASGSTDAVKRSVRPPRPARRSSPSASRTSAPSPSP
jgi:hypothetical protein